MGLLRQFRATICHQDRHLNDGWACKLAYLESTLWPTRWADMRVDLDPTARRAPYKLIVDLTDACCAEGAFITEDYLTRFCLTKGHLKIGLGCYNEIEFISSPPAKAEKVVEILKEVGRGPFGPPSLAPFGYEDTRYKLWTVRGA